MIYKWIKILSIEAYVTIRIFKFILPLYSDVSHF